MRTLATALFVLFAVATSARADGSSWETLARAAGTYEGRAASGGGIVPVEMALESGADGSLAGSYSFRQAGTTFHGTLSHGRVTGPADLVFIWHDDWGFGTLDIHFDAGFGSFVGSWGSLDDSSDAYPWVGIREGVAD